MITPGSSSPSLHHQGTQSNIPIGQSGSSLDGTPVTARSTTASATLPSISAGGGLLPNTRPIPSRSGSYESLFKSDKEPTPLDLSDWYMGNKESLNSAPLEEIISTKAKQMAAEYQAVNGDHKSRNLFTLFVAFVEIECGEEKLWNLDNKTDLANTLSHFKQFLASCTPRSDEAFPKNELKGIVTFVRARFELLNVNDPTSLNEAMRRAKSSLGSTGRPFDRLDKPTKKIIEVFNKTRSERSRKGRTAAYLSQFAYYLSTAINTAVEKGLRTTDNQTLNSVLEILSKWKQEHPSEGSLTLATLKSMFVAKPVDYQGVVTAMHDLFTNGPQEDGMSNLRASERGLIFLQQGMDEENFEKCMDEYFLTNAETSGKAMETGE